MNEEQPIAGKSLSEDDQFWLEQGRELVKNSIGSIEGAAKQLITLLTAMKGIYLAAIAFSEFTKNLKGAFAWQHIVLIAPLVCWLIALRTALDVYRSREYGLRLNEPETIRAALADIAAYKQKKLNITYWWIALGFLTAMINFAIYFAF